MPLIRLFRGRRVLGDRLGALGDGVLGQLTGQNQTNRCLDFPGGDGGLLVVSSQFGGLGGNTFENVLGLISILCEMNVAVSG